MHHYAFLRLCGPLVAATLLFPSWGAFAGETFDKIRFDIPAGYTAERGGDHIGFTHINQQAGTYCQFGFYASRPANATLADEFAGEWQQLLTDVPFGNNASLKQGATRRGIPYVMGEQDVEKDGHNYYSRLYTFQADKAVFSLLLNAPSQDDQASCLAAAGSVLESMTLLSDLSKDQAGKPGAGSAKPGSAPRGNGIAGVWMGIYMPVTGMPITGSHIEERYLSFYGDGVLYTDIPRMGYVGTDRESLRNDPHIKDYWGSWSMSGSQGEARKPAVTRPFVIKMVSQNEITYDSTHYYRCASVDGLKLDGAWTTYADPADPSLSTRELRPVLHFQPDGRFRDDGLWETTALGTGQDDRIKSHGEGRYEIRDYTLILHYDDGRIRYSALTMFTKGKAESSPMSLYIERNRLNRMLIL